MNISKHAVLDVLSKHIGSHNGITGTSLTSAVTGRQSTPGNERKVRVAIEELRLEGSHICGLPGKGYFMADSEEELDDTCLFLYGRSMTSLQQISAMKRVAMPDLLGQLNLPT